MDMLLSTAISGWLLTCRARSFSDNTIDGYRRTLKKFREFLGVNIYIRQITTKQIEEFLISQNVAKKTKLNYYVGLSSLWTWALKEKVVSSHIVRALQSPKVEVREVDPFTAQEIKLLAHQVAGNSCYQLRLRAAMLMLLDTGLRASEICSLTIGDIQLEKGYLIVMGKGSRERRVEFGPRTGQAVWRYIASRGMVDPRDPFLVSRTGKHLDRDELSKRLHAMGLRAGVENVHPHRFRHTFAVMFLRNGGTSLALQKLLGHSTMEMVQHYVRFSEVDLAQAHRRASPVENLKL